jgi:hypothetical protein
MQIQAFNLGAKAPTPAAERLFLKLSERETNSTHRYAKPIYLTLPALRVRLV